MKKVYIITDGDYSDYHIVAVFDDKKLASKFIKKYCKKDDYHHFSIEEHELNPLQELDRIGCSVYFVTISQNGDELKFVDKDSTTKNNYYFGDTVLKVYQPNVEYDTIDKIFYMTIWAKDKAHAKKIAIDKRREAAVKLGWKDLI